MLQYKKYLMTFIIQNEIIGIIRFLLNKLIEPDKTIEHYETKMHYSSKGWSVRSFFERN